MTAIYTYRAHQAFTVTKKKPPHPSRMIPGALYFSDDVPHTVQTGDLIRIDAGGYWILAPGQARVQITACRENLAAIRAHSAIFCPC